ncbi:hypothetical protein RVR_5401 [Actinacidiphila reveromycinica]|uniref:Uncharacterized protein n=1 Tax=Actinacidiphila reveromycinica TaxID=659352 RepID=A0A7U3VPR3_9ACTN|nr:hypothetical protein RVR_5401 [Streptomyces sp. SN-593]
MGGKGAPAARGRRLRAGAHEEDLMRALETIGFSLLVMAICVGLLLALMGGLRYRGDPPAHHRRRHLLHH